MVLRILKAALGVGVTVDSVLTERTVTPGGTLQGEVKFTGGDVDQKVEGITLEFTALVERDDKGETATTTHHFHRAQVSGPFQLAKGTAHSVQFEVPVPWETPLSSLAGRPLPGMTLGVSTELALDKAFDKGDLDPLTVEPLPVQAAVLDAMESLGFVFQTADLEDGTIAGSHMPFYQEIEYWPSGEFRDSFKELELTFVTGKTTTDVVLQADDHGSLLSPGHDTYQRFTVSNDDAGDMVEALRTQLQQLATRRGAAG
ncbi:sporulation-control protein [Stackebrandtia albiflava]|uniref:Sporulation-control protein n=1 Tax=Stackebrandtia albiflava TaxID=406432 RepID=A0A562VEQ9_9ACTN|nr:sporulation protein [Stackebrandtia albiflava]TWJ16360.1 sporulation-control protein [Stackebrandtia albiflava]